MSRYLLDQDRTGHQNRTGKLLRVAGALEPREARAPATPASGRRSSALQRDASVFFLCSFCGSYASAARILVVALACGTSGCVLSRSEVKSLRDADAHRIAFDAPIATTVSALNDVAPHCGPAGNDRTRIEERQVYTVTARITRIKRERDHDVHIVLADLDHPRDRLVVEADDPDFHKNAASPYREKLAAGRRMLDALVAQSGARQLRGLEGTVVRVTGVGFFDVRHFQVGRARSCIELHPVLAIERITPWK